jgi:hypothetical protein
VCDEIISAYAQHANAITFENYSVYAQAPRKGSNFEIPVENRRKKRSKMFFENLPRAYKDLI